MRYTNLFCLTILFLFTNVTVGKAIALIQMPWPQHYLSLEIEGKRVRMAYMDIRPAKSNGKTVLLLHGKNFNGWYWKDVASGLSEKGYRVIIPDQLGFGNSDYPDIHYSFHLLASNTKALLDTLQVAKTIVIGHSMGGMLATRFTLLYPERVSSLILENPIGLEDYRLIVPYKSIDEQYQTELKATYQSYKDYQKTYYPQWKPEYEQLVAVQAKALTSPNFRSIALANALTYQMIYEQPVCYEFSRISVATLLIIGQADRTIVGKALMPKDLQDKYGQYPSLGEKTTQEIKGARLVALDSVGHIPHIQQPDAFMAAVRSFLGR